MFASIAAVLALLHEWVEKNPRCRFEVNAMLRFVGRSLCVIPLKVHVNILIFSS